MTKSLGVACFQGIADRRCLEHYCLCAFERVDPKSQLWAAKWRCQTGVALEGDWETVVRLTAEAAK
jgi:hypothetical protein